MAGYGVTERLIRNRWPLTICGAVAVRLAMFVVFRDADAEIASTGLSPRIEIASPISAFPRLTEGAYLLARGQSPYAGDVYHGSPLVLALFAALLNGCGGGGGGAGGAACVWGIRFVFIALDLAVAVALRQLARFNADHPPPVLAKAGVFPLAVYPYLRSLPEIVAASYLFNPFTLLSCVGLSTAVLTHVTIAYALLAATAGHVFTSMLLLSFAAHIELYPVVLLIPTVVLLSQARARARVPVPIDGAGRDRRGADANADADGNGGCCVSASVAVTAVVAFAAFFALQLWVSAAFLGGDWSFIWESYGFISSVPDLTPNIGLWWYFFTEIFDRFRGLFLAIFHSHTLVYVLPLSLRFARGEPLFLAYVLCAIFAVFKSYPVVGDTAFAICSAMLHMPLTLPRMRRVLLPLVFLFLTSSLLASLMWFLWIYPGSGNANFLYFQTLLYVGCNAFLIIECIGAVRRLQAIASSVRVQPAQPQPQPQPQPQTLAAAGDIKVDAATPMALRARQGAAPVPARANA